MDLQKLSMNKSSNLYDSDIKGKKVAFKKPQMIAANVKKHTHITNKFQQPSKLLFSSIKIFQEKRWSERKN